jgi:hypothetical protein
MAITCARGRTQAVRFSAVYNPQPAGITHGFALTTAADYDCGIVARHHGPQHSGTGRRL